MRWGDFKPRLADALVAHLQPIQRRYAEVMEDEGALDAILAKVGGCGAGYLGTFKTHFNIHVGLLLLAQGAEAANAEAYATLDNVKQAMGFSAAAARRR